MSEILSQDQINELLNAGVATADAVPSGNGIDMMGRTGNYPSLEKAFGIFCAQASMVLSTVLNKKVTVRLTTCVKADYIAMKSELADEPLFISLPFTSGLKGEMYLLITKNDTAVLGDLMMMGEGNVEYNPEHNDAITELSNQMVSSFTMAFGAGIGISISSAPSKVTEYSLETPPAPLEILDMAIVTIAIEGREDTTIALLIPEALSGQIAERSPAESGGEGAGNERSLTADGFDTGVNFGTSSDAYPSPGDQTSIRNKENIGMLLDVDLDVSIELGRSNLSIKRILELAPGSIIELDRMAGEPVDLMVNDKVVAKGEVVVVDESFGIRIISLISPEERIKSLR